MRFALGGRVFSGIGRGRYYVGHPEYQRRFEASLGYRPYPGTLNVRLEDGAGVERMRELRRAPGTRIESFTLGGEGFSALSCFGGRMQDERVTLLVIEITHYDEGVAELVSPAHLRGRFGLKDGDFVSFEVEAPDSSPGRPRRSTRPLP
jgi:riboflavin kinase, archaea type